MPAEPHDGYVVGDTHQDLPVHPHRVVATLAVDAVLNVPAHRHYAGFLGARDLPGCAFRQPVLRLLALVSVVDLLLEETVLVVDSVAVAGHAERRHRIQEARSQAPQAPISERHIRLAGLDLIQVRSQIAQRLPALLANPQIQEIVSQVLSRQEFDGQVVQALQIAAPVTLLGFEHAFHHAITAG